MKRIVLTIKAEIEMDALYSIPEVQEAIEQLQRIGSAEITDMKDLGS